MESLISVEYEHISKEKKKMIVCTMLFDFLSLYGLQTNCGLA